MNQGFRRQIFGSYNSFFEKSRSMKNIKEYSRKYSGYLKYFLIRTFGLFSDQIDDFFPE